MRGTKILMKEKQGVKSEYYPEESRGYYQWQDQQETITITITSDRTNKKLFTPVHTQTKAITITSDRTNKKLLLLLLPVAGPTRNYLPQYTHRSRLLLLYYYQWQDQQGTIYPSTHTDQGYYYYYYTITSDRTNKNYSPHHTHTSRLTSNTQLNSSEISLMPPNQEN